MSTNTQRQKELWGKSELLEALTFLGGIQLVPGEHSCPLLMPVLPGIEFYRQPEAKRPSNMAPVGQSPRTRAGCSREKVKLGVQMEDI